MATTPQQRIQIKRRDSAPASSEGWAYLLDGELGYIKDENGLYIGLGSGNSAVKVNVTSWDQLESKPSNIISQIYLNSTDPTKIVYKKVGSNTERTLGNFAPLTNGLIDLKYLPQGALERLIVVANATARLKLTTANVQLGDTVKETDTGLMYVVVDESKLNSEDGYQVYVAGRAAAVDWTGVENKVNATASSAGLMSAADKKKLDNTNVAYGTCTTAANVAAKVITVSGNTGWKLAAGSMISIFFSYTNTAQNPTFNVNGTGAKNVYYNQSQITTSSLSYAGYTNRICNYIYDGTQFRFHSWGYDTNTNTQIRVYRNSTSSYNKDYPLIASRTLAADLGTVGTQDSNEAVYGLISDTAANIPTINPYSGAVKVKTLSATGNISTSNGNVSGKLLQTTAATNLNAVSDKVAVIKSGGQISYRTPAQIISDAGVTATVAELNYVDGATSNIQTQLNSKAIATDAIYFNQTGTIGSNGTFTNLIPSSTDLNGNVYNNIGYMPGVRWSGSGKQEVSATGYYITGFIPCETGNTLNIKNIDLNVEYPYLVLFDSSKNVISYTSMKNVLPDSQGVRSFLITESNVAFVRLVGKTIDESSVATVNEYITSAYSTGWLKKFNGAPIAPKTYISQVLDANNNPYEQHTHAYLPLAGGTLTGDLALQQNNQDRFITFEYTGNAGFDWRLGSLGTGSADENYFVIQSNKDSTNNGTFVNALRIGLTSLNALFGGNVTATKFIGPLQGNANTATILKNTRTLTIGNTGKTFNGSANVSWNLAEIGAVAKAGDTMTGFLTLHANPTANLHAATKQYVDTTIENAAKLFTTTTIITTDTANSVTFDISDVALSTCLIYYNGLLITPGINYSIVDNTTIALSDWTANKGDIFTVSGKQADETSVITAGKLNCGMVGSPTKPVYFNNNGVPVACDLTLAGNSYLYSKLAGQNGISSITFNNDSNIDVHNCLVYCNGLLLVPEENYTITNNNTISLVGWTAEADDLFIIVSNQLSTSGNDYAEYRLVDAKEPGRCVIEDESGVMKLSAERLQPGAEIISDTYGILIGKQNNNQIPIASSGRVLAYPAEDRNTYSLGCAVCSGPNGTVSQMTREEIKEYPERIIGTVSEIPNYETWGDKNIKVNGRIWIRIR